MRIPWLDNAKAIGIFLVILGHMLPESLLQQYIYSFHVPLFFFLSGYLFDRGKYDFRSFLRKKFHTLIVPYVFFAVISFLFWLVVVRNLSISGRSLAIDPVKPLLGIVYGIGVGDWRVPMNVALWFLPCLFVVETAFYHVKTWYLLPVFAVLGYLATFLPFRLPWSSDVALTAMVFYGLGHFFKDRFATGAFIPLFFVIHVACCFLNSPVDMNNLAYGNPLYFHASAYSGVLFYVGLSKCVKSNAILNYVGRNTITLIGLVGITWFVINGIYYLLFGVKLEQSGVVFSFVASILQIGLTVPAIYVINTWFPFVLGRSRPAARR